MPTYDYVCESCGHRFELFQQMSAPVETTCPECSKDSLKRLVGTGAGIIFKGSGFYETDYRSDAYKKAADSDQKASKPPGESKPDGGKSTSGGGDGKPSSSKDGDKGSSQDG